MLQTSSQGRQPFVYPARCPALAFSGSLTGKWPKCLVGYIIVQIIPSFSSAQPLWSYSVPCPSYPLTRVLFSFPSLTGGLTGSKPGCFGGDSGRDRPVVAVPSFCESQFTSVLHSVIYLLLYFHTYFAGLVLAKPSPNKLTCLYILSVAVVQWSQNVVLSQRNSIQCLMCAEFLVTSSRITVSGHSHQDLRGTLCKILGSELQSSNEDLQYVCKRK